MAALPGHAAPEIIDLAEVRVEELEPLLEAEVSAWRQRLDWDYRPSADLVRRYVNMQALGGACLIAQGELAGYTYYVAEDRKGLIGGLFVDDPFATTDNEDALIGAAVDGLRDCGARRIEAQLMMLRPPHRRALPRPECVRVHDRDFMVADLTAMPRLRVGKANRTHVLETWTEQCHEEAAQLIALAYEHHVDSQINDQYQTVWGARRFLSNIVAYPGCGSFFPAASFVASNRHTGEMQGISLASLVATDVGHITQICVMPSVKGRGVGYELLRRCLEALKRHGCRKTSLTVTSSNDKAIQLYERTGFARTHQFAAYVWDGL